MTFPIDPCLPALSAALETDGCAVLAAPPGAGKTVRVPLALAGSPWLSGKKIIMLEPRRLAARRAAEFMSGLIGRKTGETVGFRIRGQSAVGKDTAVEVVTEGILTRMLHDRPGLEDVGLLIFDEFHERSLHADLGLAFSLDSRRHLRPDLRILVMSATLDCSAVSNLLGKAPVIIGETPSFPVETRYSQFQAEKPLPVRVAEAVRRSLALSDGDVLVFLPGMREMRAVENLLAEKPEPGVAVRLLHGDLPPAVQEAVFAAAAQGTRKVILSTSIAETSLTIDGIRVVVDSGLSRESRFDPRRGMSGLVTVPVSRAVADQRRGRAGRTAPGLCLRLWTEAEHDRLPERPLPEIQTADLSHLALDLAVWGEPFGGNLSFLDPPDPGRLGQARDLLIGLGGLKPDGSLGPHGRAMAALPIHPRFSHMILRAAERGWGCAACELAALLDAGDKAAGGKKNDPDIRSGMDSLKSGRGPSVERILAQKQRLMENAGVTGRDKSEASIGLLLAWAYPDRIGRRLADRPGVYQLAAGFPASLPPGPLSAGEFIAVAEADAGGSNARIYQAAALSRKEFEDEFGDRITATESVEWDDRAARVLSRRQRWFDRLLVDEAEIPGNPDKVGLALLNGIRRLGLHVLPWDSEAERFRNRVAWAGSVLPDMPDFSDPALLENLETWLLPHLSGLSRIDQLNRLDLAEILKAGLSYEQRRSLDRVAPSHIQVPSGSRIAIDYGSPSGPVLAVRLQEMFGLADTPRVADGRVPLTLHLLSPASRPLAVTADLSSFWKNTYASIRRQMQARYPRHHWSEDPMAAAPTRRVKSRRS
ncbi:MAG: ATP-dependent helicase HrpB [bacterium]|nr:ATP-dependent helicase HrpB [bacterium]